MKPEEKLKLVGKTSGRLTVVEVIQTTSASKHTKFTLKCQCECGNYCYHEVNEIVGAHRSLSCGCLRKEKFRKEYFCWLKDQKQKHGDYRC